MNNKNNNKENKNADLLMKVSVVLMSPMRLSFSHERVSLKTLIFLFLKWIKIRIIFYHHAEHLGKKKFMFPITRPQSSFVSTHIIMETT